MSYRGSILPLDELLNEEVKRPEDLLRFSNSVIPVGSGDLDNSFTEMTRVSKTFLRKNSGSF